MKLKYMGKYDLNPDSLPHNEHKPNAVAFKEAKDTKTLGIIANIVAFFILIVLVALLIWRCSFTVLMHLFLGSLLSLLILFPHELLHAVCFKKEVYLYTNLSQGMLFVVGPEDMSKSRFIFMSLLPNIVFGFIPYIIALINPSLGFLGCFGAVCISMGAGDYYNVFNALTQMPKGARTYLYKFNSFWYIPE
ncbi:MAG: DUF3267 domain-containing protein [Lachnospiraceae bacterium]|nr:DUF3267 domain-containing protein [Lachnospira sp.]MBQ8729996.1 DUF3267 domain-containing protein [Lachnospiraceae bacterium]MBR6698327.1 DUF3267 domain-containing protein [Lachnospiraceae bacterium]